MLASLKFMSMMGRPVAKRIDGDEPVSTVTLVAENPDSFQIEVWCLRKKQTSSGFSGPMQTRGN